MNRDEIITLVLNRCGNRSNDTAITSAAALELVEVQKKLEGESELPWFLETEWTRATLDAYRIALPEDFLLEMEDAHLYLTQVDGTDYELVKDDFDALKGKYKASDPSQPKTYALVGDYFYFFPTPDVTYPLSMIYYAKEPELSDTVLTNRWTTYASDWLVGELGVTIAGEYTKDGEQAKIFAGHAARAQTRVLNQTIARREANVLRSMGD